jgi:putative ABC transport system permease protein
MVNPRLALRTLFRTPFVTGVAVLSLALGIGANVAIFSMFNQILLRPLPVREPERLVNLAAPGPNPGSQSCSQAGDCNTVFSYPMFRDLESASQSPFTGIAAHRLFGANLAYNGQTSNAEGVMVSGSYFPVLGLLPALGRLFTVDDDKTIGGHFVVVLSYPYWATKLGADSSVLNKTLVVNGQSFAIIGVAPPGFTGTTLGAEPDVFVPITMRQVLSPTWQGFENRRSYWVYLFARLKPGVSMEQARAAVNGIYHPIISDVEAPLQKGMSDQTMAHFKAKEVALSDGRRGQSSVHHEARTPLVFLFSVTGIVLLIACANIANLLMARGANRSMEMAVRLSLGAGRRQLLSQLLTESTLLAVLGGVVSLVMAKWTLGLVMSLLPAQIATMLQFHMDSSAVLFAGLLSLGTGMLFGLFPALHSTRPDLMTAIRANTGQPSGARAAARVRSSLVTAQIALSMTLLVVAGLFVRSLFNVSRVDLGVKVDHVLTFGISPALNGYDPARSRVLFSRLEDELAALPGVTGVSDGLVALLGGSNWGNDVSVEGFQSGPDIDSNSRFNEVGPGYLTTLGIPLLSGREFTRTDVSGSPRVAIVNEAFATKFHLGAAAVGKHLATGGGPNRELDTEIVGLMKDAKYSDVKQEVPPLFFRPYRQDDDLGYLQFYVRTSQDPALLLRTVPGVVARLDPNLPVEELKTMPQQVQDNVFLDRMISTLSSAFAVLATILAAVGLYGVLAYTVAQRTREIGVRMALGADGRRIRRMVLRQVAVMTLIGGVVGIGAAFALARVARSLLYGLSSTDPLVVAMAAVFLAVVAFAAGEIPALRASRVDPMQALRYE